MEPEQALDNEVSGTQYVALYATDRGYRYLRIFYFLVCVVTGPTVLILFIAYDLIVLGVFFLMFEAYGALFLSENAFMVRSVVLYVDSQVLIVERFLRKRTVIDLRGVGAISLAKSRSRLNVTLKIDAQGRKVTANANYTQDLVQWARAVVAIGEAAGVNVVADVDRPSWRPSISESAGSYKFVDSRLNA